MTPMENGTLKDAPKDIVYLWYSMLTKENKEKVNRFIADLKETQ